MHTLLLLCVFILFFSLVGFYLAVRPFKYTSTANPSDFGVAYENVSFRTKDNILIDGWFIPNSNRNAKTIILLHGYPADKGNILPVMISLHKDYNLLFFDFRYFGKSGGLYTTIGDNEVMDLLAAIQYLHSRGIHEVGVWGFSLGGAVALMTAAKAPEIKIMVIDSSYARLDWLLNDYYKIPLLRYPLSALTRLWALIFLRIDINKISPAQMAEKITIPVLLIHSRLDNFIPFTHAQLLGNSLRHDPKLTTLFSQATRHGELIINYQSIVKKYFDENFK